MREDIADELQKMRTAIVQQDSLHFMQVSSYNIPIPLRGALLLIGTSRFALHISNILLYLGKTRLRRIKARQP